ncbi:MAG: hypothetical protein IE931_07570 [Sphingobacteriales bacterium]|nr:hypothetical protein [Sphingobacteriales bacterium]
MKTYQFKSPILLIVLGFVLLTSCKKNDEANSAAKAGELSCKIDGKVYNPAGSGYILADDHTAVKAENGAEQFSINFYGISEGDYTISDGAKASGNAKLQYFTGEDKVIYTAKSGTFKVTKYQKTGSFKVSGIFSGKFEKYINNNEPTGIIIEVSDGIFTDIKLSDVR